MKNVFFGKLLSAVTASAMAFSFIIGAPFDFGVTVEANAEDYNPSVITYATAEQLGDSTTFAPDPVKGVGNNIAEIYFGEKDSNPVSWYILGGDSSVSGNNMMLFATTNLGSGKFCAEPAGSDATAMPYEDGDGDYSGTAPSSVYANHYGASDLREYFKNMATDSSIFSEEEQALLNETTITTDDVKNGTSYTTTDKLYALQVAGTALCIGPENTMLNRETYWEDGVFLSRTPNVEDFDNYDESAYCRWIYIMNYYDNPIISTMSNFNNGYRPATNIDLSDVLFASCAAVGTTTSEYKINVYSDTNPPPLTLRLDGSDKNIGTVTYTGDTITAKKGTTNETVAIVVQGKGNNGDWSCSKVITGTETITKEDIENSSGMFTVLGELSDCRIWLEIVSEDNLRYAVTATQVDKQTQTITASDVTLTYGETGKKISATTDGDGVLSYEVTTGEDVISVLADGTITALKAGTATVTINAAETADYAAATTTVSVTVNKKKIAVPAADTTEYTYNGTAQTYGVTSTDDYTVTGGTQTDAGEYPITITLNNENYEWDGTLGTYTFIINKAAVTVTAKSYTIKVGDTLPTYAYDVTGLVNNETLPIDVTISCNAADSNTAGTYTITVSGAANSTNYTFAYVNGTLIVSNKEEQTITASDVTLTYGDTNGKITAATDGDGAITYSTTSDVISIAADGTITALKAGTATVTINAAETADYAAATKTVTVTVNKAAVTVTAKSYTIKVGDTLPTYAYDVTGLVNGETLPIDVTISCNAADSNTAGTYDIIVSGAAASDNYTFSYVKGTLTVSEKEVVAAPTFTPASGTTFTASQKVTISCATAGAKIYYTTDGTEPTTASTLYNGAFTITTTTTIKAIAVKDGMTDSAVVTATYTKKSSGGGGGGGGGYRPSTPTNPEIGGKSASWATIASDISKLPIGSETTIELNGNYDIPVDVIKAIADRDVKVTFIVDSTRSWYVDGAEIETPTATDLSIIYIASLKADGLRGDVGTKFRVDGTNISTELVVALDKKHAGKFANLYKKKENELVFVDNIKVDENGKVILPVSEQGDYVIMLCEYSDRTGDVSNDGVTNALDASAILKDIVELEEAANPVMLDYNGDGKVNALDASAILKDIVNGKI